MELIEFGPIPLGILSIYIGTQLEEKNGENRGKTTISIVLYIIGSILIVGGLVYLVHLFKKK